MACFLGRVQTWETDAAVRVPALRLCDLGQVTSPVSISVSSARWRYSVPYRASCEPYRKGEVPFV